MESSKIIRVLICICIILSTLTDADITRKNQNRKSKNNAGKTKMQSTKDIPKEKKLLKVIEENFLNFMGMRRKPKTTLLKKKMKIPKELWDLYLKWSDENYEDDIKDNSDTARIIHSFAEDHVQRLQNKLNFDVAKVKKDELLHKAELHLFTENVDTKPSLDEHKNIIIYQANTSGTNKTVNHTKVLPYDKHGYVKIDVTSTVKSWLNNSIAETSLVVDDTNNGIKSRHLHIRRRRDVTLKEWEMKRPVLMLYSLNDKDKPSKIRKRRQAKTKIKFSKDFYRLNKTHRKEQKEKCRLRDFYLDFKDVAWDEWILAPTGYNINYCRGECPKPLGPHYNTTNHAVIQTSVSNLNKGLVPPLCCIPTTLKDQTFLYLDDHGALIVKNPLDMIAVGCGCH